MEMGIGEEEQRRRPFANRDKRKNYDPDRKYQCIGTIGS